ncbi:hypothetical protein ES703_105381 [subsurface metagenome]
MLGDANHWEVAIFSSVLTLKPMTDIILDFGHFSSVSNVIAYTIKNY